MALRPRIAVDAMSGEGGPETAVAALDGLSLGADFTLIGDRPLLVRALGEASVARVVDAAQVVTAADSLHTVLRKKKDSSLRVALQMLGRNEVDAVVSGADTAALMGLARLEVKMVPGLIRPAILKALQGVSKPLFMLDLGANIECSAIQLHQFARMGSIAAARLGGVASPSVGLLNIGTEPDKGPAVLQECARRLSTDDSINYAGFVEASGLFDAAVDVVVCDGFPGNVALKAIEGAARMAGHLLAERIATLNPQQRSALDASTLLARLGEQFNPESYNGAALVGLRGVVVKSHAAAGVAGTARACEEAVAACRAGLPAYLATAIENMADERRL